MKTGWIIVLLQAISSFTSANKDTVSNNKKKDDFKYKTTAIGRIPRPQGALLLYPKRAAEKSFSDADLDAALEEFIKSKGEDKLLTTDNTSKALGSPPRTPTSATPYPNRVAVTTDDPWKQFEDFSAFSISNIGSPLAEGTSASSAPLASFDSAFSSSTPGPLPVPISSPVTSPGSLSRPLPPSVSPSTYLPTSSSSAEASSNLLSVTVAGRFSPNLQPLLRVSTLAPFTKAFIYTSSMKNSFTPFTTARAIQRTTVLPLIVPEFAVRNLKPQIHPVNRNSGSVRGFVDSTLEQSHYTNLKVSESNKLLRTAPSPSNPLPPSSYEFVTLNPIESRSLPEDFSLPRFDADSDFDRPHELPRARPLAFRKNSQKRDADLTYEEDLDSDEETLPSLQSSSMLGFFNQEDYSEFSRATNNPFSPETISTTQRASEEEIHPRISLVPMETWLRNSPNVTQVLSAIASAPMTEEKSFSLSEASSSNSDPLRILYALLSRNTLQTAPDAQGNAKTDLMPYRPLVTALMARRPSDSYSYTHPNSTESSGYDDGSHHQNNAQGNFRLVQQLVSQSRLNSTTSSEQRKPAQNSSPLSDNARTFPSFDNILRRLISQKVTQKDSNQHESTLSPNILSEAIPISLLRALLTKQGNSTLTVPEDGSRHTQQFYAPHSPEYTQQEQQSQLRLLPNNQQQLPSQQFSQFNPQQRPVQQIPQYTQQHGLIPTASSFYASRAASWNVMPIQQSFYSASSMGTPVNSAYNHPAVQFTSPQSYNCGSQCDPCCCKVDQPAACCGNLATPYLCTGDGQRLQVTLGGPSNGPQGYVIQEQKSDGDNRWSPYGTTYKINQGPLGVSLNQQF